MDLLTLLILNKMKHKKGGVTLPKVSVTSNSSNYGNFGRVASYIKQLDVEISATQLVSLFYNFNNLKSVNIKFTSAPTTMQKMFKDCGSLQEINFSNLDTSLLTNTSAMFSSCSSLINVPIFDTSNVTDMSNMFGNNTHTFTTAPNYNTQNAQDMGGMFYQNQDLINVPIYNTSSVQTMRNMFYECTSLSNSSLNNILQMCANAINYTSTKTLSYIGLSSEQIATCQTLSNWTLAQSAGWTTGI